MEELELIVEQLNKLDPNAEGSMPQLMELTRQIGNNALAANESFDYICNGVESFIASMEVYAQSQQAASQAYVPLEEYLKVIQCFKMLLEPFKETIEPNPEMN